MLKVLRNKDRKAESDRRERQMSYLSNVLTERPMLRVTASVILAFCCAAPLVWLERWSDYFPRPPGAKLADRAAVPSRRSAAKLLTKARWSIRASGFGSWRLVRRCS
jgi:hypothetical protein